MAISQLDPQSWGFEVCARTRWRCLQWNVSIPGALFSYTTRLNGRESCSEFQFPYTTYTVNAINLWRNTTPVMHSGLHFLSRTIFGAQDASPFFVSNFAELLCSRITCPHLLVCDKTENSSWQSIYIGGECGPPSILERILAVGKGHATVRPPLRVFPVFIHSIQPFHWGSLPDD